MKKIPLLLALSISALPPLAATSAHAGSTVRHDSGAAKQAQHRGKKNVLTKTSTVKPLATRKTQAPSKTGQATPPQFTAIRSSPDQLVFNNADGISVAEAYALYFDATPHIVIRPTGNTRLSEVANSAVPMATAAANALTLKSGKRVPLFVSTLLLSDRFSDAYGSALGASYNAHQSVTKLNTAIFDLADAMAQEFPALKDAGYDFVASSRNALVPHNEFTYGMQAYGIASRAPDLPYDMESYVRLEPTDRIERAQPVTRAQGLARTFKKLTSFLLGKKPAAKPVSILQSHEGQ